MSAKVTSGRITIGTLSFASTRRQVGNRQRFPKKDAAIAAFAVERVEAIKNADDETP